MTPLRPAAALLLTVFLSPALFGESTPSPALLISATGSNALLIADPKDRHIVATIPTINGPRELAVSSDGKLAMVSSFGSNSIALIDLVEQKEIARYQFSFRARPNSMVFADGKFWVTVEDANAIASYNPQAKAVEDMIGIGQLTTHVMVYNPTDKTFITASRNSDTVTFIDQYFIEYANQKRLNWKVTPVPGVHWNEAMDLTPDKKELWFSEFRGGKVGVLDVASRTVKDRFELPDLVSDRLRFTPDGKRVLISDLTSGNLVVLDRETHKEIQRMKIGDGLEGLSISPDGAAAYMCSPRDNVVHILDLKTMKLTGEIPAKGVISAIWVP
jgi:DNA-binding beta-propeller fold protein YncE